MKRQHPNTLPPHIQQAIKERMNEPNREALTRELGIGSSSLYRYIRKYGGIINHKRSSRQPGTEDMIREYYPYYTASEIAHMKPNGIALSKSRICTIARRLGVVHTPETRKRIQGILAKNREKAYTPENRRRIADKRRRVIRMEILRVNSGMPQKTRIRLKRMPTRHWKAAYNLETKYRYIITTNPYVLWYDEGTRRTPCEQHYVDTYGFTFEQAQE